MRSRMKFSLSRPSKGFTLVELVIVIAIVGVLASVALPRFASLQSDARAAKADAFAGAIRTAAAQVKALSFAKGASCDASFTPASSPVSLEGVPVGLAYCYPAAPTSAAATDGTIIQMAGIDPQVDQVTLAMSGDAIAVRIDGASDPSGCQISYAAPTGANEQPTVSVIKSGC